MKDSSKYYTLLRDPTRRRIIEILAAQEKVWFKELRDTLGLGVGTVYYHLDILSDFVAQDKQRKYYLNERGRMLHRILKDGDVPAPLDIGEAFTHRVGKWVFLSPLFAKTANPVMLLPFAVVVLLVGGLGAAVARLDSALFFFFSLLSAQPSKHSCVLRSGLGRAFPFRRTFHLRGVQALGE
ncbi:MAG: winged helix-turn-helix domain-containing protein [Candidatus Bathyarchaeota archaeon]|nr:winged helix-turn-helix domain-containing protein [Candidatus Bathyarchaeota archaeon]